MSHNCGSGKSELWNSWKKSVEQAGSSGTSCQVLSWVWILWQRQAGNEAGFVVHGLEAEFLFLRDAQCLLLKLSSHWMRSVHITENSFIDFVSWLSVLTTSTKYYSNIWRHFSLVSWHKINHHSHYSLHIISLIQLAIHSRKRLAKLNWLNEANMRWVKLIQALQFYPFKVLQIVIFWTLIPIILEE